MRIVLVLLTLVAPLALAQSNGRSGRGASPDADAGALPGDDALTCEQLYSQMNTLMAGGGMQSMLAQQQALAGRSMNDAAKHPELMPKGADVSSAAVSKEAVANFDKAVAAQGGAGASQPDAASAADAASKAAAGSGQQADPALTQRPGVGKSIGGSLPSSFGGSRAAAAQQTELQRQAERGRAAQKEMEATAQVAQAQIAANGGDMTRGMRLVQLAQAKRCAQQTPSPQPAH